jgi:sugar/nucleoside kinase (ribokinase family)
VELAPYLAVVSPNLLELQTLLSITPSSTSTKEEVEHAAKRFHEVLQTGEDTESKTPAIIVRAGRLGSYTVSSSWTGWVKPYFSESEDEQGKVVDPTGGGNGFLGGLCAGLLVSGGHMRIGESADISLYEGLGTATDRSFGVCCYRC